MKIGLLDRVPGRGPGSGVRLSAYNLTVMILACMATDDLAVADIFVPRLLHQKNDSGRCRFTKAATLGEALTLVIADEKLATSLFNLVLMRNTMTFVIRYAHNNRNEYRSSMFGRKRASLAEANLEVDARLPGSVIRKINSDLATVTGAIDET